MNNFSGLPQLLLAAAAIFLMTPLPTADALPVPVPQVDQSAQAWLERGVARVNQGDYQGAIEAYDRAIALQPDLAEAYSRRATARCHVGDRTGALADDRRAEELFLAAGNPAEAARARSALLFTQGNFAQARDTLLEAIRLGSTYEGNFVNLAASRLNLGDREGAIADLERYVADRPDDPNRYRLRAQMRVRLGDRQGALADIDQAISLAPEVAYYRQLRARWQTAFRGGMFVSPSGSVIFGQQTNGPTRP